jgi:N-acetylmuramoyl-L-alanine amidase
MNLSDLQTYLNIPITNEYDEFTTAAIRNFEIKNGIFPTGQINDEIVKTIDKLNDGLLDTDIKSIPTIKQYRLKSDEYFVTNERKRSIFLHHTAGWHNPYNVVNDWERDQRGKIGTAYLIGGVNPVNLDGKFDGEILECMPPKQSYAWHLGIGNNTVHRTSVGIELCHFGWVTKDSKGGFRTYTTPSNPNGTLVNSENVIKLSKPFRGYEYWIKYSDSQLKSMEFLIKTIGKETGIDITLGLQKRIKNFKDVWMAFDYDADIVRSADGLFTHTNVSPKNKWGNYEKWDLFPQDELIDLIKSL